MLEKLKGIKEKFDILTREIADPQVIADTKNWQKKVKETYCYLQSGQIAD